MSSGVGFADVENGVRMTPKTIMRIASISKSLTSAAIGLLHERGKLDLDCPIQKYLPDIKFCPPPSERNSPNEENKDAGNHQALKGEQELGITVRMLSGHLAGIRHYKGEEFLSSKRYSNVKESLAIFKDDPLVCMPGEKYNYTTFGWR